MLPNEQKTQQSPGMGFSRVLQWLHSWNHRQASVGIVNVSSKPHCGQVNNDCSIIVFTTLGS